MLETMRLLSWNGQGLENPWIVHVLHKMVTEQAPVVCLFIDTRMYKEDFKKLCKHFEKPHWYIVKKLGLGGGLALLWKEGVDVCVINHTDNHILAKIVEDDDFTWFLTGFYGWPKAS